MLLSVPLTHLFANVQTHVPLSFDGIRSEFKCVFERPAIFGASISAGYGGAWDGLQGRRAAPSLYFGSNPGPATRFAQLFNSNAAALNISEISSSAYPHGGYGYPQIKEAMTSPSTRAAFEAASAWVTVEGFYWPAINNDLERSLVDLQELISLARNLRKPLFIGNVPIEKKDGVSIIVQLAGWAPPNLDFVQKFNSALEKSCLRSNECYIINLHETVRRLNGEGLDFREKLHYANDFRFDGVHLKPIAIEWLMTLMQGEVYASPPACIK